MVSDDRLEARISCRVGRDDTPCQAGLPRTRLRAQQMPGGELHYWLAQAAAQIRTKRLSPVELTQAVLTRIDHVEPGFVRSELL